MHKNLLPYINGTTNQTSKTLRKLIIRIVFNTGRKIINTCRSPIDKTSIGNKPVFENSPRRLQRVHSATFFSPSGLSGNACCSNSYRRRKITILQHSQNTSINVYTSLHLNALKPPSPTIQ